MAIEGFDATLLIDNAGFRPQVEIPEADSGSTLDMALRQSGLGESGNSSGSDAVLDRAAMRAEMAALDLWINDEAGNVFRSLEIGGGGAAAGRFAGNTNLIDAGPNGAADAYILRDLSTLEKKLIAGGQGTTDPEIVVTGPSGDDNWSPWDDDPFEPGDNDGNPDGDWEGQGGPDESDPSPNPYLARVTIDDSVPPEARERAEQVREKLAAELRDVGEKINSLDDNQIYRYGDREVTGAELKAEFAKIGFNITWNEDYGPRGAGANANGIVSANLSWLEGKLAENHPWGDWGTNWLILHELAHLLGVVEQFEREMWQAYRDSLDPGEEPNRDDWQGTQWFRDHEALTDWFAYLLGQELGLPTGPRPPTGYDPNLVGSGDPPTDGTSGPGGPGPGGYMLEN